MFKAKPPLTALLQAWSCFGLALLATACAGSQPDLQDYLGPQPGVVYVYQPGDYTYTVTGVSQKGDVLEVEEAMPYPAEENGWDLNHIEKRHYTLRVEGAQLVQQFQGVDTILLRLTAEGSEWSETWETFLGNATVKLPAQCRMEPTIQEEIFGRMRTVLSTYCIYDNGPGMPKSAFTNRYAEGIGLVEEHGAFLDGGLERMSSRLIEIKTPAD